MWRWLLAIVGAILHWTVTIQAQLVKGSYLEEEEELEEIEYVTLDDGTVVAAGGNSVRSRVNPTLASDREDGRGHDDDGTKQFTGWMWISAFAILAFGGAGLIFMVAREAVKFCRRCQEREAGIQRAQSVNALNSHRTQLEGGHFSTPGSPMGPRVFAPNIVLSAFSGPHR